jgi:TRAP-type transport system periplasmic protein
LNVELEAALKDKGMVFNRPEKQQFREHLSKAGFYGDWKKKYGPQAWAILEKYAGTLS